MRLYVHSILLLVFLLFTQLSNAAMGDNYIRPSTLLLGVSDCSSQSGLTFRNQITPSSTNVTLSSSTKWRLLAGINFTTINHYDFSRALGASLGIGLTLSINRRLRLDLAVAGTYSAAAIELWANDSFGLNFESTELELFKIKLSPRIIIDLDDPTSQHFYLITGPELHQVLSATFVNLGDGNENVSATSVTKTMIAITYGMGLTSSSVRGHLEVRRTQSITNLFSDRDGRLDGVEVEISIGL